MIEEKILGRLLGVKKSGPRRWIARCPSHQDRSPSLSLAEVEDGRILLHCHAGCEVGEVLDALGLRFSDLFPEPLTRTALPRMDCALSAAEALSLIRHEAQVVAILAAQAEEGARFSEEACERLHTAVGRINETYARVR